jgi:hypothetical protein
VTGAILPPRAPLVVALLATVATLAITRFPAITVQSETGFRKFGLVIAADGPRLVAIDATIGCVDGRSRCAVVLRIDRLRDGRVTVEGRFDLGEQVMIPAVAIRGETVVVHADNRLRFFGAVGGTWRETQALTLPAQCQDFYFQDVHLGERILVVESREVWCIYESIAGRWAKAPPLPHETGTEIALSHDRVMILDMTGVTQYEHRQGWRGRRVVEREGDELFFGFATSDRWLVVSRYPGGLLHVYDLDDGARRVATLAPTREGFSRFAVGATTIATVGDEARAWRFTAGRWIPAGWLEGATDHAMKELHPVAIGDAIWIGDPSLDDDALDGGRIHGYPP